VSRAEFWILNFVSVALVAMIVFEMYSSDQLDRAQGRARLAQLPLLQEEQLQPFAQRMVELTAQGAVHDPALKDLLTKYGFRVTIRPPLPAANPIGSSNP
jgi:hypothetical protein